MRLSPDSPSTSSSILLFLLPTLASSISLDCSDIQAKGVNFNLKALGGPHSVYTIQDHAHTYKNTTYTIDICQPLKRSKGVPKEEDCPNNTRVCAIERLHNVVEDKDTIEDTWTIAGEFSTSIGGHLDPVWTRLKSSASTSDREKEGLRLEMSGGTHDKQKQKAIVEFLCQADGGKDKDEAMRRREEVLPLDKEEDDKGDEDEKDGKDEKEGDGEKHDASGEIQDDNNGGTLKYISWDVEEDNIKVLRLEWQTKYACEDAAGNSGGKSKSGHWGFFTWLIIILFMGIAAYLIFGSWLNYNRYSARGWDVLPHSDTIQDLPYLFRDWMRRVINTVQGGGSRGGYSAV